MKEKLSYAVFKTSEGWVGLLGSVEGLRGVTLPHPTEKAARMALGDEAADAVMSTTPFRDVIKSLQEYFSGRPVQFHVKLDCRGCTPFQQAVWEAARRIPFGKTHNYGWVARQMGKPGAARAVGQALGRNPFPVIVPCHRVLAADGGLGGFSGGLARKKQLLKLEKASNK